MSRFSFDAQRLRFLLFSIFLVAGSVGLILWIFPAQRAFNYEYAQGRPWRYETLYAPFDFSIKKTEEQLKVEREVVAKNKIFYFDYDDSVVSEQIAKLKRLFQERFAVEAVSKSQSNRLESQLAFWLDSIQRSAVFGDEVEFVGQLKLIRQNQAISYPKEQAQSLSQHKESLKNLASADFTENQLTLMRQLLSELVTVNARLNQALTESAYQSQVEQISMTRGLVPEGSLIVAKGEIIEAENFQILESLKYEYQSTQIEASNTLYIFLAYSALVSLVLILLMLYLRKYRRDIFENSNQLAFVYINIVLMVLITTLLVDIDERFVYLSPLSILPLVLKNFFDARVALFTHILTILIIAMTVSNAYEFVFLQIVAGVVVMIGSNELQKRTNLFAAAFQITVVYLISYVAFHGLNQGGLRTIDYQILLLFVLNGMITLFAQPLIYLFEKFIHISSFSFQNLFFSFR